jgi:hypothetical protein
MPAESLTTSESLMLDVLRTVAAIVVAFGHLTQKPFSTNWPDLTPMAVFAVVIGVFAGHPAIIFKKKLREMFSLNQLSKASVRSQS